MREDGDGDPVAARVSAAWTAALYGSDPRGTPLDPGERFLAAGGHSLAAARLIARLRTDLAVELPVSVILRDDPPLTELIDLVGDLVARRSDEAAPPGDTPPPLSTDVAGAPRSARLAPSMRRVWTWHRLHPESPAYNVVRVLEVADRIQPAALRAALADLTNRHETLRCSVVEPSPARPELSVDDQVTVPLSVDVVRSPDGDPAEAVDAALRRTADRPFPMDAAPLWRVGLVYAPQAGRSWLILVMHHLVSDLRASDLVLADLAQAYRARAGGRAPEFAGPAPSLLDHLAHEHGLVDTPRWEEQLDWWARRLAGSRAARPLPLSTAAPAERTHRATTHTVELPPPASEAVDRALHEQGLTPALYFLTVANAVLGAWRGEDRTAVVGLPSARINRPDDERLVGFLLDTLPLPLPTDRGRSFTDACRTVRDVYAGAADHALPAYDDIVDRLRLPRAPGSDSPLIELWFNDLTRASPPPSFGGHTATEYDLPPAWALFGLSLYLHRGPTGFRLHLVAPLGAVEPADLAALAEQIVRTATRAALDPTASLGELLEPPAGPDGAAGHPGGASAVESTVDLVRRHAARRPTAVALTDRAGTLDYRSLDARIDEVAAELARTAGSSAVVAIPAARDRWLAIRLLACWRAGATAVLIDAKWPRRRRERALEIAAVTHAFPWSGDGPAQPVPHSAPPLDGGPSGPAYVLFTSGTTGDPLAVRAPADRADAALADLVERLGVGPADRVSMLSGPAHDPVLRDLGVALRAGATVCVPPPELVADPARLGSWLRRERVSVTHATPAMLALVLGADPDPLPDLRAVVSGGSPLSAATVGLIRARAAGAVVLNGYGCTETPQLVIAHEIGPDQPVPRTAQVPIGEPLPGRRVELRTTDGRRCDVGQVGELWVAGPHIADGYLGAAGPDRFGADETGLRWLRTGDLARRDARGRLHLGGRRDRQTLVNGHRVTLEEIESAARGHAGVTEAVAEVVGAGGSQSLRVWVQRSARAQVTGDSVRAHLEAVLPPTVVPARVLVVDRLELSGNLKPVAPGSVPPPVGDPAGTTADRRVRDLAGSVLGRPFDPAANFFDAGFTSVSLLQLSAELAELLGRPVDPIALFDHPNLNALTAFLVAGPADRPTAVPPPSGRSDRSDRSDRLAGIRARRRQARAVARPPVAPAGDATE
ncbi:AMP-binding protein [Kitasatospora sp. NPDC127059]|uniref:AMP-binding protein n=1 Tax=unclassified Kitasatospora TaxID=2633591 RepID=UPI00364CB663